MNIQGFTPSIDAPQMATNAVAPRATTAASSSSSTSSTASNPLGSTASSLQTTFLNLLVTELQNQDPTSPVDPTQMVGQMVSLNQLDQLMSINQTLDSMSGTASSGTSSPATANAITALDSGSTDTSSTSSSSSPATAQLAGTAAASQQLPAYTPMSDPSALMNLYGSFGTPAATQSYSTSGGR